VYVSANIGETRHYQLSEALLIYKGSNNDCFISRHGVAKGNTESVSPVLLPAQPLTKVFIESLLTSLGGGPDTEVLPSNVLAKSNRLIAWWTPKKKQRMFFTTRDTTVAKLNGKMFSHPALVWLVSGKRLSIRALMANERPEASTKLAVAPYWNLADTGEVCLGNSRTPNTTSVGSLEGWEKGFFESTFTHSNVGRSTRHPDGFAALWQSLTAKDVPFPDDALIPLPQTLSSFIQGKQQ
jgi:PRTRC genetic system protein B